MYLTICVEWVSNHFGLGLTLIDPLFTKICAKNNFYIFVPSDLALCPVGLKFAAPVTLAQRYVFTK